MNFTQKMMAFAGLVVMIVSSGCSVSRDQMTKEYDRLAALPPVSINRCPEDRALDSLAIAVSKNYEFSHKLMKEYVGATANRRAYLGFMNDIEFYVKEEKMEQNAAIARVVKEIQEADSKVADPKEKLWPKVVEGINCTNALNLEQKLYELAPVVLANAKMIQDCQKLKNSFKGFDPATIKKAACAAKILVQATDTAECLGFLSIQFKRTIQAKTYVK